MALSDALRALGGGGVVAVVVEFLVGSGQFALMFGDFVVANAEIFLGLSAVLSGRLAPEVGWLPEGTLNALVLLFAVLVVGVYVARLARAWRNHDR